MTDLSALKIATAVDPATDKVVPITDAEPGDGYECRGCGGELSCTSSYYNVDGTFNRRYFSHKNDACGYEDPIHIRMKQAAVIYALERWPEAEIKNEDSLKSGEENDYMVSGRKPDVRVDFADPDADLGDGVCIECQHQNKGKDLEATEFRYGAAGYSTMWTWGEDLEVDKNLSMTPLSEIWHAYIPNHEAAPVLESKRDLVVVPVALPDEFWVQVVPEHSEYEDHRRFFPDEPDLAVIPVTTVPNPNALPAAVGKGDVLMWFGFRGSCGICGAGSESHEERHGIKFHEANGTTVYTECLREQKPRLYNSVMDSYGYDERTKSSVA